MFSSSENNMCTCNYFNNILCAAGSNELNIQYAVA